MLPYIIIVLAVALTGLVLTWAKPTETKENER
jgi:hypothetical protein